MVFYKFRTGESDSAKEQLCQHTNPIAPHRLLDWCKQVRSHLETGAIDAAQQILDSAQAHLREQASQLPAPVVERCTRQFRGLQLEIWLASEQTSQIEAWFEETRKQIPEEEWVSYFIGYTTLLAGKDRHTEAESILREGLKHYPKNFDLIIQWVELAKIQGRPMQAIQLLRRAIRLAEQRNEPLPLQIELWVRLSTACLHTLAEQAHKAAEKANQLVGELVENELTPAPLIRHLTLHAKTALALAESESRRHDEAETLLHDVLAENPYLLNALQGLGQQQMQRGKIDEAITLFERIKVIDPVKGATFLINARKIPEDEAILERMEKLARQPSLEGRVHSGLLFQLASAWEKKKVYDKAISLAHEANEASRQFPRYDPKIHRQRCARIRHAFPKALFEHRKTCGYRGKDESLPVFVLGMPRSGTTLVEQIIAGHSQIFGAGELGIIPSLIQGLNRWERHVGSGRSYPDCVDDLNAYVTEKIARGILTELKELAANDKPAARHIVDKLPHNFENIGLIKYLFPQAKIISVRRDPRDIAFSNYFTDYQAKHGGMGFAYHLTWIGEQLADHNLFMHHWHQLFPGEILEIRYEDVIENTEAAARKMLAYIGVEWEEQVLSFNTLDRPVKTASVWQVRQPIYQTSKEKWRCYRNHLAPLIQGTNAKITWEPIDDMVTLPTPGMFTDGVAFYKEGKLDEAEYEFKKLLHHLPEHAAANFMVGLIYARKGHLQEGIALMEKGLEVCPWNRHWRQSLIHVCTLAGKTAKVEALKHHPPQDAFMADEAEQGQPDELDDPAIWWAITGVDKR
ncbi:MAG: sulfotransferase [Candidatus Competibacteraceae bacterium]|nr:sulfotransferase [Candidatus Competibacteraceae bacterium]MCP5125269.1 sulfotransferase [Gammaproteobacteria bacterium]